MLNELQHLEISPRTQRKKTFNQPISWYEKWDLQNWPLDMFIFQSLPSHCGGKIYFSNLKLRRQFPLTSPNPQPWVSFTLEVGGNQFCSSCTLSYCKSSILSAKIDYSTFPHSNSGACTPGVVLHAVLFPKLTWLNYSEV